MPYGDATSSEIEGVVTKIMDAAFKVHRALGPGLLESVYEACLSHELTKMGLSVKRQMQIPIVYDGITLDTDLRIDLLVADRVLVELKAVERENSLHQAQVMTYLKLTGIRIGLLINFNVQYLKDGFKRIIL